MPLSSFKIIYNERYADGADDFARLRRHDDDIRCVGAAEAPLRHVMRVSGFRKQFDARFDSGSAFQIR